MKKIFGLSMSLVLAAVVAKAGNGVERDVIEYGRSASELPADVRERLNSVVAKGCPALTEMAVVNGRAMAVVSKVEIGTQHVDQGVIDITYGVVINVPNRTGMDAMKVVLKRFDGSNPAVDWLEVVDFETPEICRSLIGL